MMPAGRHPRLAVASRVAAALFGGYGVSALALAVMAAGLARVVGKADGVWLATMLVFPVYVAAAVFAFATRAAWRAWAGLGLAAAVLAVLRFTVLA